jgi:hypothetical protein
MDAPESIAEESSIVQTPASGGRPFNGLANDTIAETTRREMRLFKHWMANETK